MSVASKHVPAPDLVQVRRALISVSDKTGLVEFAKSLAGHGVMILSTGGTAQAIRNAGIEVTDVSAVTGFPEIMDGRVKTLHPAIHGALLAVRDDPEHAKAMQDHGIEPIDLLVVNLYPFETVAASGASYGDTVENIDIGGPAMIRAAAKNHAYVGVATDPADYSEILEAIRQHRGSLPLALRRQLSARAFSRTAAYDSAIAQWYAEQLDQPVRRHFSIAGKLAEELRYGENPHQSAAFYLTGEDRPGVATAVQLQGKQLSWNNINDTNAAFELVSEFDPQRCAAVAIIKHANPCGVATAVDQLSAYRQALACDPVSAFGGIIALNRELDAGTAAAVADLFVEVIVAPGASEEAKSILAGKKNLRVLLTGSLASPSSSGLDVRTIAGGLLVQSRDNGSIDELDLKTVTKRQPTERELDDMRFAFRVAKHVKSNAIVYARDGATVGIGAGQMSRIDSSRIAVRKAQDAAGSGGWDAPHTRGSVVASDAFFPFADGLVSAIEAGATAVIQPGGSMRDAEVIEAADKAGIAMVFTGMRHFRH
ncbi:MAG: bifunctional phosphoribosylaminoimidazolecarboxamide formyltransferase/IMP cyclohydrolase [Rhizobiaceae bacterium]